MLEKLKKQYTLEVVQDLGMFTMNNGTYKQRKLVLLCPICNSEFTVFNDKRNKARTMCYDCVKSEAVTNKHTRLYNIWKGMRSRVNSKDIRKVYSYSSKGIIVCDEWQDFTVFKEWALANGYTDELTIDREDNDGNYEPSNCRWVGAVIQGSNTRTLIASNTSGFRGVSRNKSGKYHAYITVEQIRTTIGYYETDIEAAKAYDSYVLKHSLPHTINNVLENGEYVEPNLGKTLSSVNKSGFIGVSFIKRLKDTNRPYFTQITVNSTDRVYSKYFPTAEEAAFHREHFIFTNTVYDTSNLKHNFTYEEYEQLKTLYLV